jgi:hypothetical protein
MDKLSENERRTFDKFMRTELGQKVLANVARIRQDFLDAATTRYTQGQEFIHSQVSAAAGVDAVYYYLKPKKATEDEKAEE